MVKQLYALRKLRTLLNSGRPREPLEPADRDDRSPFLERSVSLPKHFQNFVILTWFIRLTCKRRAGVRGLAPVRAEGEVDPMNRKLLFRDR